MVFIDDSQIRQTEGKFSVIVNVIFKQLGREDPMILKEDYDTNLLQKWLLSPKKRYHDICILGALHRINELKLIWLFMSILKTVKHARNLMQILSSYQEQWQC